MTSAEFQERLATRARTAGVRLAADVAARLEAYYRLLATWNARINLSGHDLQELRDDAIDRLLVEPVAAAAYVVNPALRILDIGSGGGSPAIPLALAAGAEQLVMVESKTRKGVFLREALRAVELNGEVLTARFEDLDGAPELRESADVVSVRAVRVDADALRVLERFVRPGGVLLLFGSAASLAEVERVLPLSLFTAGMYGLLGDSRSQLVVIRKRDHERN